MLAVGLGHFLAVGAVVFVLGVFGMNYSTLLERRVDFDPFSQIQKLTYPSAPERVVGLQLIQMLWERGETNGYAAHLTDDPLPGSGANRVLLVPESRLAPCFGPSTRRPGGITSREQWWLVSGPVDAACAAQGSLARAIPYAPRPIR